MNIEAPEMDLHRSTLRFSIFSIFIGLVRVSHSNECSPQEAMRMSHLETSTIKLSPLWKITRFEFEIFYRYMICRDIWQDGQVIACIRNSMYLHSQYLANEIICLDQKLRIWRVYIQAFGDTYILGSIRKVLSRFHGGVSAIVD
jgi:hypothetical protein